MAKIEEKRTQNPINERLVIIPVAKDLFADVSTKIKKKYEKVPLEGIPGESLYVFNPYADLGDRCAYNVPFLFKADGSPWIEANNFLMHLLQHKHSVNRPTDDARRKASRLLDYAMFCEREGVDWLDFNARLPSGRPTYRYFKHMCVSGLRSPAVINQYTGTVYDFYKYVSRYCHKSIDLKRVDTVTKSTIHYESERGRGTKEVEVRSQTKRKPGRSEVPIGYIREDGEDLRPLTTVQMKLLLADITELHWSVLERLILQLGLFTGARKQSVLTLRMKHLQAFNSANLKRNGTYPLDAGPGTGIDTKNGKKQTLYVPKQLAEDMTVWAFSPPAKQRRLKMRASYAEQFPGLPPFEEDDFYIFLSDQGNVYYMAKDDPRYPIIKSPPIGQVTDTLKRKIGRCFRGSDFPKDFSYHWLRATFAYQLYLSLQPLVDSGKMKFSDQLGIVKERLHHESVTTTENYLNLFSSLNERLAAQEGWENQIFGSFAGDYHEKA